MGRFELSAQLFDAPTGSHEADYLRSVLSGYGFLDLDMKHSFWDKNPKSQSERPPKRDSLMSVFFLSGC